MFSGGGPLLGRQSGFSLLVSSNVWDCDTDTGVFVFKGEVEVSGILRRKQESLSKLICVRCSPLVDQ